MKGINVKWKVVSSVRVEYQKPILVEDGPYKGEGTWTNSGWVGNPVSSL